METKATEALSVILSTRVRLARNLKDYPFGNRLDAPSRKELIEKVVAVFPMLTEIDFSALSKAQSLAYLEKHLVSQEFMSSETARTLLLSPNEEISIMLPEEDHIRLQVILPGFATEKAYQQAASLADTLENALPIAFDKTLGYLTHCPTNLGTGMRVSVMAFLPGLRRKKELPRLQTALGRMGFTVRGIYGEGSGAAASLYQISNQITMGITMQETCEKLSAITEQIISAEMQAREALSRGDKDAIADDALRSYGILRYCKRISSAEFWEHYEKLRLGIAMGLPEVSMELATLDALCVKVQPGMLTHMEKAINEKDRDKKRAAVIQNQLTERGK